MLSRRAADLPIRAFAADRLAGGCRAVRQRPPPAIQVAPARRRPPDTGVAPHGDAGPGRVVRGCMR